jgi:hypothetical protein
VHGFNSTVFAYGQTSSGKTHTMRGTPAEPGIIPMAVQEAFALIEASQDREFLLRVSYMEVGWRCAGMWVAGAGSVSHAGARSLASDGHSWLASARGGRVAGGGPATNPHAHTVLPALLRCSPTHPQIYNEDINDLLAPQNLKLPIHESKESGIYVAGLREDIVVSVDQVMQLITEGESNRHIGATKMNEGSSRSHTVFRMVGAALWPGGGG